MDDNNIIYEKVQEYLHHHHRSSSSSSSNGTNGTLTTMVTRHDNGDNDNVHGHGAGSDLLKEICAGLKDSKTSELDIAFLRALNLFMVLTSWMMMITITITVLLLAPWIKKSIARHGSAGF
jgi:hypothetical protein